MNIKVRRPLLRLLVRLALPTLLGLGVLAAAPAYGALTAESRLSPALREQLKDGSYAYSVFVDFGFQPEYFHIRRLQAIGTVAGVEGRRMRVVEVTADQVREIGSVYWVQRVVTSEGQ